MKIWFVILAAAAMWLSVNLPFEKTDVGELSPVSLLLMERCNGKICVTSDQGDTGIGDTLTMALEDMELTSPGRIFFDTVEHLLFKEGTTLDTEELSMYFRPGVYLCACVGDVDPVDAAAYLQGRNVQKTLTEYEMDAGSLPVLIQLDGRYYLNGETS